MHSVNNVAGQIGMVNRMDLLLLVALVLVVLAVNPILKIVTGVDTPLAVVRGCSMYPLLRQGDLVIIVHKDPDDIRVGDIIVYRSLKGHLIIHRVVAIIKVNGKYEYVTKGDHNPHDDSYLFEYPEGRGVPYSRVIGVVWRPFGVDFKIPYVGYLALLLGR